MLPFSCSTDPFCSQNNIFFGEGILLVTWMLNCKCAVESNISLVEVSFPISV